MSYSGVVVLNVMYNSVSFSGLFTAMYVFYILFSAHHSNSCPIAQSIAFSRLVLQHDCVVDVRLIYWVDPSAYKLLQVSAADEANVLGIDVK